MQMFLVFKVKVQEGHSDWDRRYIMTRSDAGVCVYIYIDFSVKVYIDLQTPNRYEFK